MKKNKVCKCDFSYRYWDKYGSKCLKCGKVYDKKTDASQLFFYKKVVSIPIYFGNFIILFSNDIDKVASIVKIKKTDIGSLYAYSFHNFLHEGKESFCLCLNLWSEELITIGSIMHEISHTGNRLLAAREIEKSWDNDEAESYLKGWMGDEVGLFLKECDLTQKIFF